MRVAVADDNPVVRAGVGALLQAYGMTVVAEAADGTEALAVVRVARPDVVLLDVRMPGVGGLAVLEPLARLTRVVVLTYTEDPATVISAVRAGAGGYLVHGRFSPGELVAAVRGVARGQAHLSPVAASALLADLRHGPAAVPPVVHLVSAREAEVMAMVARGMTNTEVARALHVVEKTVKNHLNNIYPKLGVRTRTQAVACWLGTAGGPSGPGRG